jgi:hypothetical protein
MVHADPRPVAKALATSPTAKTAPAAAENISPPATLLHSHPIHFTKRPAGYRSLRRQAGFYSSHARQSVDVSGFGPETDANDKSPISEIATQHVALIPRLIPSMLWSNFATRTFVGRI